VEDVVALDGSGRAREVPGGYAAWWEAHRGRRHGPAAAAVGTGRDDGGRAPTPPTRSAGRGATGRSPSTLRRLLAAVEREIEALDRRRADAAAALVAAGSDRGDLARAGEAAAEVEAAVADAESRWVDLAEELEAAG
jgi:hypothetical protein